MKLCVCYICPPGLLQALQGFKLDFCEIREGTFAFFSSLAQTYTNDFASFLPTVLPLILSSMDSDEGVIIEKGVDDVETGDVVGTDSDEDEAAELTPEPQPLTDPR